MATFAEVSSHLIDELRTARDTAATLVTVAADKSEITFAENLARRIEDLLDELGCYD